MTDLRTVVEPLDVQTPVDLYRVIDVETGRPWSYALQSKIHSETVFSHSPRALVAHIVGPDYADLPSDTGLFEQMYALPARVEAMHAAADAAAAAFQSANPSHITNLSGEEMIALLTPSMERDGFIRTSDLREWTSELPLMTVVSQWHFPTVLTGATVLDASSDIVFLRSLQAIRLVEFIELSKSSPPF